MNHDRNVPEEFQPKHCPGQLLHLWFPNPIFTAGDVAKAPKYCKASTLKCFVQLDSKSWHHNKTLLWNPKSAMLHVRTINALDYWLSVVFRDISPSRPPPSLPQSNAFARWVPLSTWHLHPPTSLGLDFKNHPSCNSRSEMPLKIHATNKLGWLKLTPISSWK